MAVLRTSWKNMTMQQKIGVGVELVCDIGADLLCGYLLNRIMPANEKPWKRVVASVTMGAVGIGVGQYAADSINNIIETVTNGFGKEEEHA